MALLDKPGPFGSWPKPHTFDGSGRFVHSRDRDVEGNGSDDSESATAKSITAASDLALNDTLKVEELKPGELAPDGKPLAYYRTEIARRAIGRGELGTLADNGSVGGTVDSGSSDNDTLRSIEERSRLSRD